MNKNLRWKLLTIVAVFVIFFARRRLSDPRAALPAAAPGWLTAKQLSSGSTSRAACTSSCACRPTMRCRLATTTTSEQLREELQTAGITVGGHQQPRRRRAFQVEGVPPDRTRSSGGSPTTQAAHELRPQPGRGRRLRLHDEAEHREATCASRRSCRRADDRAPRQRARRRRAEHLAHGQTGDQILVQLPGRHRRRRAKEIIRSTGAARAEDRRGRAGADARRRCSSRTAARSRPTWRSFRAPASPATPAPSFYLVQARSRRSPAATCAARSRRSTRTTGRRSASR